MAPIGKKQIIESDDIKKAFEDVYAAAMALTGQITLLTKEGTELAKVLANGKTTSIDNAKAAKEYEKILQEQAKTEKQLTEVERVKLKLNNEIAAAEAKKTKEAEKAARSAAQEASAYAKLSKEHTEARNKAKDLAAQYGTNSKAFKEAAAAANKLDAQLKKIDGSLGQHQRNVGNYGKAWQGLGRGLMGAFGITIGLSTIGSAMKSAFNKQVEFEKGLSSLSSITGLAGKQLQDLGKKAKQMSKDSTVSAVDTLKAMELIGSAKPELLKSSEALAAVTKEAITLSEAAGMELPDAASALTDAMNQFGLGADQAARVINVLAAGSKEGAVAIPQVTEAMKQFGTVAKGANITIEQSTALIEALGERGINGAEAGTKLRNFLITLQAGAKETNPAVVGLSTALNNLQKQNLSTTEATKLFGKENVVAAQILMESVPTVDRLTKAVTGTNTAYEQAAINTNNFAGASKRLSNSWDDLLLSLGNTKTATQAVKFLAESFNNLSFTLKSTEDQIEIVSNERFDNVKKEIDGLANASEKISRTSAYIEELRKQMNQLDSDAAANDKLTNTSLAKRQRERASVIAAEIDLLKKYLVTVGDEEKQRINNAFAASLENESIKKLNELKTQFGNNDEWVKLIDAEIAKRTEEKAVTVDLIKEKEKELSVIRDTPAATEAEISARNMKVKAMEDEIKRLKELGTIRQSAPILIDSKEIDKIREDLAGADEEYIQSQIDLYEREQKLLEESERAKAEIRMQWADTINQGLSEISDTLFGNMAQSREDDLNNQIEYLQKRLDNDKLDDEQRAEIQKQIDEKEKKLKVQAAKAEKTEALMKLGVDTALTIAKIKAQAAILASNPITLPFAAGALAQIPFVLVSSALSATAIAAKKIPEYFMGTDHHEGGLAIVGDGGERELVEEPSGKKYLTPATSTLMELPRGTKVVPGDGVAQRLSELTHQEIMMLQSNNNQIINVNTDALLAEQVRTRKAIESNKSNVSSAAIRDRVRFEMQREKMRN